MLAIVIPYYKLSYFDTTLESLVNQSDQRFKVYIGDDNSPEDPRCLLEIYAGKLNFVYHRFDTNLGKTSLTQQWERCVSLSNDEDWIMILGDDDCIGQNCVEDFYKNIEKIISKKHNVVRFASIEIDENDKAISKIYQHPKLEKATDSFFRKIRNKTRSSLSEYIFNRKVYQKYGFFNYDLAWYSDDRAWLEFSESNFIYTINSSQIKFRLSNQNISRATYKIHEKNQIKLQFFNFLIFDFLKNFNRYQRKYLLLHYEQLIYKNQRLKFRIWFSIFLLFFKNFYIIQSIKFTRRVLIHLNKKNAATS